MIALFRHYYPGEWRSPGYRTRTGVVPWNEFLHLYQQIPMLEARHRLHMALAMTQATTAPWAKDGDSVQRVFDQWEAQAYPEEHR